jgi:ABC-2 type transport system ATP-binding protein
VRSVEAIRTYDLAKYYGNAKALDGIDLDINEGEIFTILGPNGAGKTTFLLLLATVLKPTRGTAVIKGLDIRRDSARIREIISMSFQEPQLYWRSNALETLKFHASMYGIRGSERDRRIRYVLNRLQLERISRRRLLNLSGGQVKRVEIAKILVQRPSIAFFDEPTAMVDLDGKHIIWEEIKKLRDEGSTVLVATNEIYEAEILSDRVAIFDRGRLFVVGGVGELKEKIPSGELIEVRFLGAYGEDLEEEIRSQFKPTHMMSGMGYIAIRIPGAKKKVAEVIKYLMDRGLSIESVSIREPTLDDVFLYYTKRRISEP